MKNMKGYRGEIDGLRAIAVIPVVLFHFGVPGFSGGFVGVDVFFVISGFLITAILHREISSGQFTYAGFYRRRARRILPNLFAMFSVTTIAVLILMIPLNTRRYGESLVAATAFLPNIYFFWRAGDYFAQSARQMPLLHTWSLGVEEQFYLIFPVIMRAVERWRWIPLRLTPSFLLAGSLLISEYQVRTLPSAAFYLPMGRFWELMIGALLALNTFNHFRSKLARQCEALVGILLILLAVNRYTAETPFPGLAALLPCVGAMCVIHANATEATVTGRFLSSTPLRFVGLISYSLYLWHWPVFVLSSYVLQRSPSPLEAAALILLSFALSVLAWRYIETPMRSAGDASKVLRNAFIGCSASILVGATLVLGRGFPRRFAPNVRVLALGADDINRSRSNCDRPDLKRIRDGKVCFVGVQNHNLPTFAVIGDSFADALSPGVAAEARDEKLRGMIITISGCAPLEDVSDATCNGYVDSSIDLIKRTPSIRSVLMIARWSAFVTGWRFGMGEPVRIPLKATYRAKPESNTTIMAEGFAKTLATLRGKQVMVLAFVPEQRVNVPQAATLAARFGWPLQGIDITTYQERQNTTREMFERLQKAYGIDVIDAGKVLCNSIDCPVEQNGRALYVDDNHLTATAAIEYRAGLFAPFFAETQHLIAEREN